MVGLEQECGASGIAECDYLKQALSGYIVETHKAEHSKEWRAKPASASSEQGRIKLVRAPWNKDLLSELQAFPLGKHDDQVDALSGAFNMLSRGMDYSAFKNLY
jgi:predicted phage terminase large subunit-like protein